ncbi:GTP 3',8-cyclase MoaA [Desulfatitalea tepidiphila]|uniref:GTP 3',8-cyclase MoaA n=1 Tax=Desulfatitalea tepidiphila TaxID=1185843 RepID=UPI00097740CC|nr:GTP 3',8-cyclase MoaA [Desulfatitalea tepidiphila]
MKTAPHCPLSDHRHRVISYLRVSVTDRCNLRCRYCMTSHTRWLPKGHILTLEEIHRMVRIAVGLGITKVRLTGGEPLYRKGIVGLVQKLAAEPGIEDLSMTTNGTLLAEKASALKAAGLKRINISLDTTDPQGFAELTGRDLFSAVWQGIMTAREVGFTPIKINAVVLRGCNDDQIEALADLSRRYPFHVRFIEYMPIATDPHEAEHFFFPITEIAQRLEKMGRLLPVAHERLDGPAQRYRFADAPGEIGLIGSMSSHFCDTCNRMRLTADGHLRPCLLSDEEVNVIDALRQGAGDEEIAAIYARAVAMKKGHHRLSFTGDCSLRTKMASIGG